MKIKIVFFLIMVLLFSCSEEKANSIEVNNSLTINESESEIFNYINLTKEFYDYHLYLDFDGKITETDILVKAKILNDNNETMFTFNFYNDGGENQESYDLIPYNNVFSARLNSADLIPFGDNEYQLEIVVTANRNGTETSLTNKYELKIKATNSTPSIVSESGLSQKNNLDSGFNSFTSKVVISDSDYNPNDDFETINLQLAICDSNQLTPTAFDDARKILNYSQISNESVGEIEFSFLIDSSLTASLETNKYRMFLRAEDKIGTLSNIYRLSDIKLENLSPKLNNIITPDTLFTTSEEQISFILANASDPQSLQDIKEVTALFEREGSNPFTMYLKDDGGNNIGGFDSGDNTENDGTFTGGLKYSNLNLNADENERTYTITFTATDLVGNKSNLFIKEIVLKRMDK